MRYLRFLLLMGCLCAAFVGLACSSGPPTVADFTLATAVNDKKEPTTRVTSFPAGATEVIAAAKVENFKSETKLQAQFFRNNDKLQAVNYDGGTAGSGWVAFSLTSSGGPLEAGDYKVEIYQDGAKVKEITFKVG